MRKAIAAFLPVVLVSALVPVGSVAFGATPENVNAPPESSDLVCAGTAKLSNDWDHTIQVYANEADEEVWGEGTATDPSSVEAEGTATRWLSYTFDNGHYDFVGSYDGEPVEVSLDPDDILWTQDDQGNWRADLADPGSEPQPLAQALVLVLMVGWLLSGDDGCACGHSGGTPNHPGTNPPEPGTNPPEPGETNPSESGETEPPEK